MNDVSGFLWMDVGVYLPFGAVSFLLLVKYRPPAWPQWETLCRAREIGGQEGAGSARLQPRDSRSVR